MTTLWSSQTKSNPTWSSGNKSTVEKAILTEDGFNLLCEDGEILLQEDDNLDYSSGGKSTTSWFATTKN